MSEQSSENEIKYWLTTILKKENVTDLSIKILGGSNKGDGYASDIVFVEAEADLRNGTKETFNLVLKCSKKSLKLRENLPMQEIFLNEIHVYDRILPAFQQFQQDKGIEKLFDSMPKYYGNFTNATMEIIALENLKKSNYVLWNKQKPLTRKHIDMMVEEYGKFHAISVALKEQKPEIYKELISGFLPCFKKFIQTSDLKQLFGSKIDLSIQLLKNEIDEKILLKWKDFKEELQYIGEELIFEEKGLKVITHGDCWSNNLMFKHKDNNENLPLKAALLDWQMSMNGSPITDLSYFLFACISNDDIEDLDDILQNYYNSFSIYLRRLGNDAKILYPHDQFLADWKRYCKFGLLMIPLIFYACSTDKDEVIDMAETAEKGQDFEEAWTYELKDSTIFKTRMSTIVNYVVKHNLI